MNFLTHRKNSTFFAIFFFALAGTVLLSCSNPLGTNPNAMTNFLPGGSSQTPNLTDKDNTTSGFGGGTSVGTTWSSVTDSLANSNYLMLSQSGSATDLELDPSWTPAWSNLVGYWKLNEASGTVAANSIIDSSPVGTNKGSPNGGITFGVSGKLSTGAQNTGSTSKYISVVDSVSLKPASLTVSAWVYPTSIGTKSGILGKPNS